MLNWIKENITAVLEVLKVFLQGQTVVTRKHEVSSDDSYSVSNSTIVILFALLMITVGFICRWFGV